MYRRFTDRARCVMRVAEEEADRYQSDLIETEHLLLALADPDSNVAVHALGSSDIDLDTISDALGLIPGEHSQPRHPGFLHRDFGDEIASPTKDLSSSAHFAIESAEQMAKSLNHGYIGTEHLLLGLLRHGENRAIELLRGLGVEPREIVREVLALLGYVEKPDE